MKKLYSTPVLDIVKLEDKPSISMNTNNVKTFNASSLEDSCGYEELTGLLTPEQISAIDVNLLPGIISQLTGFDIVAS